MRVEGGGVVGSWIVRVSIRRARMKALILRTSIQVQVQASSLSYSVSNDYEKYFMIFCDNSWIVSFCADYTKQGFITR